jgi:hypothetical protein
MLILEVVLVACGIFLLIDGYRKSNRNVLLIGAVCMLFSGSIAATAQFFGDSVDEFANGLQDGYRAESAADHQTK